MDFKQFNPYYSRQFKNQKYPWSAQHRYTGQYYTNFLQLLHCNSRKEVDNLPYKFKYAKGILNPEHLSWFYSQLEKEDKQNIEIKEKEGTVDPLYSKQMIEIESYKKKYNVKNVKELIMAMYDRLSSYTGSPSPGIPQRTTAQPQIDMNASPQSGQ